MKKILIFIIIIAAFVPGYLYSQCTNTIDWSAVKLTRIFAKELFEANGIKYMQPLAEALNSTSNSRFFNRAYVPKKVKNPYFRLSLNGMAGFVREDMKSYKPHVPYEPYDQAKVYAKLDSIGDFSFDIATQKFKYKITGDTTELMAYIFKLYTGEALRKGIITEPETSPTILGAGTQMIGINTQQLLDSVVKVWPTVGIGAFQVPIYSFLDSAFKSRLEATILSFPSLFHLPTGGDFKTLYAGIPQFELGSLFGTEMLLRFIPPVNMGSKIGDFAFWGFGLKHSLSQYFGENPLFDMAIQGVYQGTYLKNKVPESGAELTANANIWDFNIQISKNIDKWLDFYTGFSYENLSIVTDYKYYIPVEVQRQLNLLRFGYVDGVPTIFPAEPPCYPGDTEPQYSTIKIKDTNLKWVIGARVEFGAVAIILDCSISKFNIFTAGLELDLNKFYNLFSGEDFFNDGNY